MRRQGRMQIVSSVSYRIIVEVVLWLVYRKSADLVWCLIPILYKGNKVYQSFKQCLTLIFLVMPMAGGTCIYVDGLKLLVPYQR